MAQIAKISEQVQLKSCGQKFYDHFANKMDRFAHLFPQNLKGYEFVEGNGFTHGSVMYWIYYWFVFGQNTGIPAEVKTRLMVDEPNKSITFECVEGDLLKDFEVFQVRVEVTDGGNSGMSSVRWCMEFVKKNEDVPSPHNYLQFGVKVCKGLDAYLSNK
ncbi:kirola-like [Momordica charantia]|uniref:Kirola-like n=1 Tax=Momordica charantia TaxID=3673 RepID=A0A6J1CNR0_MOMCH|nr:kirola-like [Momordica charantia]